MNNPIKVEARVNGNGKYWIATFEGTESPKGISLFSGVGAINDLKIKAAGLHHSPYPPPTRERGMNVRGVSIE